MPNHGYCKNCWWYKELQKIDPSKGRCYMRSGNEHPYINVMGNSYCRDYFNKKRSKQSLDDWISSKNLEI